MSQEQITLDLTNIEEGQFFKVENEPIIFLDKLRRCYNVYINKKNPTEEYFKDNQELLDKLEILTDNYKGVIHNNLVNNFYKLQNIDCIRFSAFLCELTKYINNKDKKEEIYVYINIIQQFYRHNKLLVHIDLDLDMKK